MTHALFQRRITVWILLLAAGVAELASAEAVQAAPNRPNVLFIMTDDHASHAISAYGSRPFGFRS